MKIVRRLSCDADALYAALERRFLGECSDHGCRFDELGKGVGYEDRDLGFSVLVEECARGSLLTWRARTRTDEVVSTYEIRPCGNGCEVVFLREYVSGLPAQGRLAEALLLGRMSNELLDLYSEARSPHEEAERPVRRAEAPSLSERLLRRMFG